MSDRHLNYDQRERGLAAGEGLRKRGPLQWLSDLVGGGQKSEDYGPLHNWSDELLRGGAEPVYWGEQPDLEDQAERVAGARFEKFMLEGQPIETQEELGLFLQSLLLEKDARYMERPR